MSRITRFFQKNHKSETHFIFDLRRKKCKTKLEKLLIKYFKKYAITLEVCIGYSKQEYSAEYAMELINKYLNEE